MINVKGLYMLENILSKLFYLSSSIVPIMLVIYKLFDIIVL